MLDDYTVATLDITHPISISFVPYLSRSSTVYRLLPGRVACSSRRTSNFPRMLIWWHLGSNDPQCHLRFTRIETYDIIFQQSTYPAAHDPDFSAYPIRLHDHHHDHAVHAPFSENNGYSLDRPPVSESIMHFIFQQQSTSVHCSNAFLNMNEDLTFYVIYIWKQHIRFSTSGLWQDIAQVYKFLLH